MKSHSIIKLKNTIKFLLFTAALFFVSVTNSLSTPVEYLYSVDETASRMDPTFLFPNEQGGYLLIGYIGKKQIAYERVSDGIFILNLIPDEDSPDSLIVDFYNKFFVNDTSSLYISQALTSCTKRDDGSVRIVTSWEYSQLGPPSFGRYSTCPYVVEFDKNGNIAYSFADVSWHPENGGTGVYEQMVPFFSDGGVFKPFFFANTSNFAVINATDKNIDNPHPTDTLYKYKLVAKLYDSLGKFIKLIPIVGLDTMLTDSLVEILYYSRGVSNQKEDGTFELKLAKRNRYPPKPGDEYWQLQEIKEYHVVIVDSNFNVISQEKEKQLPVDDAGKSYFTILSIDDDNNNVVYWHAMQDLNPDQRKDASIKNIRISVIDTFSNTLKHKYEFHDERFTFSNNFIMNSNGDYTFAGNNLNLWGEPNYSIYNECNYAAAIVSKDFQTMKVYENPEKALYSDFLTVKPIERADGRYEFFGSYGSAVLRLLLDEEDFVNIDIYTGIEELYPNLILASNIYPNPASGDCTLSMDMTEASSMSITLSDMLGRDIMQIYDGYAEAGTFSKAFNTKHLASGVYSVIIRSGDKIKAEKLIINR